MTAKTILIDRLLYLLYLALLTGVVFGFRAISSIAIGLLLVAGFMQQKISTGAWLNRGLRNRYLFFCTLLLLLQIIPLSYSNAVAGWRHVELKSALLFIPLSLYCCSFLNKQRLHKLMTVYVYLLTIMLTWCVAVAAYNHWVHQAPATVFFYHSLTGNLGMHAVQTSILVFAGLVYLLERLVQGRYLNSRSIHRLLVVLFTAGIILLSSKLVIFFMLACLAWYGFMLLRKVYGKRLAIALVVLATLSGASGMLLTNNPVSERFNDMLHGNVNITQQASFSPDKYFNGLEFRLLQWRFVKEILNEQHAWVLGVTPAGAQPLLNQKYLSTHMYTGEPGTGKHGFLGYNAHNQFLESLLQSGLPGLCCFMLLCVEMMRQAARQKSRPLTAIVVLLLAYAVCESVLETQYGLIIFALWPVIYTKTRDNS